MKIRNFFFAGFAAVVVFLPQVAQAAGWAWWHNRRPQALAPATSTYMIPELSLGGAAAGLALALGGLLVFLSRRRRRQHEDRSPNRIGAVTPTRGLIWRGWLAACVLAAEYLAVAIPLDLSVIADRGESWALVARIGVVAPLVAVVAAYVLKSGDWSMWL
jgi:hypothetical protein